MDPTLGPILALYAEAQVERSKEPPTSSVHVGGRKPVLVPAQSLRVLEGTTRPAPKGQSYCVIVEEANDFTGPHGFAVCPAIVNVGKDGRVTVKVPNSSEIDIYLHPWSPIGHNRWYGGCRGSHLSGRTHR